MPEHLKLWWKKRLQLEQCSGFSRHGTLQPFLPHGLLTVVVVEGEGKVVADGSDGGWCWLHVQFVFALYLPILLHLTDL